MDFFNQILYKILILIYLEVQKLESLIISYLIRIYYFSNLMKHKKYNFFSNYK